MMDSASAIRPAKGQKGSITVMVALLLPTLVLMIMLVADIGQLIFEKIRLQNVADACAYSAATVQAAGLNEIADLNYSAEKEYFKLLGIYVRACAAPFKDEAEGKKVATYYEKVFKAIKGYQDDANKDYARKAINAAKSVKKANLDSLGVKDVSIKSINPKTSESQPGKLMEYEQKTGYYAFLYWEETPCESVTLGLVHCDSPATSWQDSKAGNEKQLEDHDGTDTTSTKDAFLPMPSGGSFKYKIKKKNSPVTYSAFELKHPPHDLILAPSVFGRTEALRAYAAAMPTGGSVGSMPAADAMIALGEWVGGWAIKGVSMDTFSTAAGFLKKVNSGIEAVAKKVPLAKAALDALVSPTGMDATTLLEKFGKVEDMVSTVASGDTKALTKLFGIDTTSSLGWIPIGGYPQYKPVMVRLADLKDPKPKADDLSKVLH